MLRVIYIQDLYAECHYAEFHYAECHCGECYYAECCGAVQEYFKGVNKYYMYELFYKHIEFFLKMARVSKINNLHWVFKRCYDTQHNNIQHNNIRTRHSA